MVEEISEDFLQSKCWEWAWNYRPQTRRLIWAVPNGGFRDMREAMKMKATGTLEGVHDLHMFWKGKFYTFELKVGNNQLTRDRIERGKKHFGQFEWGELITSQGGQWFEVRSLPQFQKIIDEIIK